MPQFRKPEKILADIIREAVEKEREECARLIEDMDSGFDEFSPRSFVAAIRNRKNDA